MSEAEIDLFPADQRSERQPGETVELSSMWSLDAAPKVLEARLFWFTRGKGTEDLEVVETQPVPSRAVAGEYTFRFVLPIGPYSFSGPLISLGWTVEFVADQRSTRWDFTLSASGREVRLPTSAPIPRA